MRQVRGADVAMIFQEPMTSLNPVFTEQAHQRQGSHRFSGTGLADNRQRLAAAEAK
jgi:ABC-type microcin C transport system duplicated ATPase subunit YejF